MKQTLLCQSYESMGAEYFDLGFNKLDLHLAKVHLNEHIEFSYAGKIMFKYSLPFPTITRA